MIFKHCPECGSKCTQINIKTSECINCRKRWYDQPVAAVDCIVINNEGEILLTVRAKEPKAGTLTIPGGFVDQNEFAEDTLIREVREESGAEISELKYFNSCPSVYQYQGNVYHVFSLTFTAKFVRFSSNFDPDETENILWLNPERIDLSEIGLDNVRSTIKSYLESISAKRH